MRPEIFSKILHPVIVVPVTGLLYLSFTGISVWETTYWISIWIMTSMVPTVVYVWRTGDEKSLDIISSIDRRPAYGVGLATAVGSTLFLYLLSAPVPVITACLVGLVTASAFAAVNYFSKVSVHTGATTASGTLLLTESLLGLLLLLLSPLVAWSRVKMQRHSSQEVLAGGLLGVTCVLFGVVLFL